MRFGVGNLLAAVVSRHRNSGNGNNDKEGGANSVKHGHDYAPSLALIMAVSSPDRIMATISR